MKSKNHFVLILCFVCKFFSDRNFRDLELTSNLFSVVRLTFRSYPTTVVISYWTPIRSASLDEIYIGMGLWFLSTMIDNLIAWHLIIIAQVRKLLLRRHHICWWMNSHSCYVLWLLLVRAFLIVPVRAVPTIQIWSIFVWQSKQARRA